MASSVTQSYKLDTLRDRILNVAQTSNFQCWVNAEGSRNDKLKNWIQTKFSKRDDGKNDKIINSLDLENISLTCCDASLPGSSFLTHDVNVYTGVTERFAYTRAYDDRADFTFYINEHYLQLKYFEFWMAYIADEQKTSESRGGGVKNDTYNYRMNYPDNYRADISISKFERDFGGYRAQSGQRQQEPKSKLTYVFKDAYPISINSIPVSYDSSELLKCTVSFTYSRYYLDVFTMGLITPPNTKPSFNNPAPTKQTNPEQSQPPTVTPARSGQSQPANSNTIGQEFLNTLG